MNIPKPNEFAASKGFKPFPPRWERWLSSVRNAILSSQPVAGRHITIDVHTGKGTVVNADDDRRISSPTPPPTPTGACCIGTDCSITTEAACTEAGGTYQGDGSPCDPNPCESSDCSGGATVLIEIHATGSDTDCPTLDLTDSVTIDYTGPSGSQDFDVGHRCIGGCDGTNKSSVAYHGSVSCVDGVISMTFIGGTGHGNGISACCGSSFQSCDPDDLFSCSCYSVSAIPDTSDITGPGVYHYNFTFTGPTRTLDVTVTVTTP